MAFATSSCSATTAATRRASPAVAARLDREWAGSPVRVHAVEEYYRARHAPSPMRCASARLSATREIGVARGRRRHLARARRRRAARAQRPACTTAAPLGPAEGVQRRPAPRQRRSSAEPGVDAIVAAHARRDPARGRRGVERVVRSAPAALTTCVVFHRSLSLDSRFEASSCVPRCVAVAALAAASARADVRRTAGAPQRAGADAVVTVPGMPPVPDPRQPLQRRRRGQAQRRRSPARSPRVYVPQPAVERRLRHRSRRRSRSSTASRSASTRSTSCRRGT